MSLSAGCHLQMQKMNPPPLEPHLPAKTACNMHEL
jgi:hypothetical protein